jgi:hypothetical protein
VLVKLFKTELERLNIQDLNSPRFPSLPFSPKILGITQSPTYWVPLILRSALQIIGYFSFVLGSTGILLILEGSYHWPFGLLG